jgi:hypothetical protein
MKRVMFATSLSALVLFFALSWASPKSKANNLINFSGTWQMDAKRSQSAHVGEPIVPVTLIIRQTATNLSIETRQGGQSETLAYKLDGSASGQAAQANGPVSWSARWNGDKLVTETTRNINASAVVITEIRSLDQNGKEMTIDRTLAVQHGYEFGQATSTAKDIFVKAL